MAKGKLWKVIEKWCMKQLATAKPEQFWPAYQRVDVRGQPPVPHLRFSMPVKECEAWGGSPVTEFWIEVYRLREVANFNPPGIWIAVWQSTADGHRYGPHVVGFTDGGSIQESIFNEGGLFWRAIKHLIQNGQPAMLLPPTPTTKQPVAPVAPLPPEQSAGVIEYDGQGKLRLCSYQPGGDLTHYLPLVEAAPEPKQWGFEDAAEGELTIIERMAMNSPDAAPFIGAWFLAGPWSEIGRVAADGTISTDDKTLAERLRRLAEASKE